MQFRSGQTLLEVLIASTVIVVGIVSLLTALLSANTTGKSASADAVATQLAREVLEAAKFVRDSNALQKDSGQTDEFYTGLRSGAEANDYTGVYMWNPAQTNPELAVNFQFTADAITHSTTVVYKTPTNDFRQSASPAADWVATPYRRFVTFFPICSDDQGITEQVVTGDGSNCTSQYPGTTQIGIRAVVRVQWLDRGAQRSEVLETSLYNWRYASS